MARLKVMKSRTLRTVSYGKHFRFVKSRQKKTYMCVGNVNGRVSYTAGNKRYTAQGRKLNAKIYLTH